MEDRASTDFHHEPVLVAEAVQWLGPAAAAGGLLVDCTAGGGGHAEAFLKAFVRPSVLVIDRDPEALEAAGRRLRPFGPRVELVKGNFSELASLVARAGHESAQAVFYDLGVSSFQLDRPERGFQYRRGAPLDMRMDPSSGQTAAEIVNNYSENELNALISQYGEERFSRRVARAVVKRRKREPFQDAGDLADVVKEAIPAATRRTGPNPARRTFQALRIEVNRELESLRSSLHAAVSTTAPGGRIAAISYQSLEDRLVKATFAEYAAGCECPPDFPVCRCERQAELRVLTRKPVRTSAEESSRNPRSDSARLRVAEKLATGSTESAEVQTPGPRR